MTKSDIKNPQNLSIADNPYAPDLYADEAIGFLLANNTMRITLASARFDHTKEKGDKNYVVTSRLVMPVSAAANLHKLLGTILESVKTQRQMGNTLTRSLQ